MLNLGSCEPEELKMQANRCNWEMIWWNRSPISRIDWLHIMWALRIRWITTKFGKISSVPTAVTTIYAIRLLEPLVLCTTNGKRKVKWWMCDVRKLAKYLRQQRCFVLIQCQLLETTAFHLKERLVQVLAHSYCRSNYRHNLFLIIVHKPTLSIALLLV